jgi:hypothetical protein
MLKIGDHISKDVSVVAFINREHWNANDSICVFSDEDKNIFTIKSFGVMSVGQKWHLTGTVSKKKTFGKREQFHIHKWKMDFLVD